MTRAISVILGLLATSGVAVEARMSFQEHAAVQESLEGVRLRIQSALVVSAALRDIKIDACRHPELTNRHSPIASPFGPPPPSRTPLGALGTRRSIPLDTERARATIISAGKSRLAERSVFATAVFSMPLPHRTGRPKLRTEEVRYRAARVRHTVAVHKSLPGCCSRC